MALRNDRIIKEKIKKIQAEIKQQRVFMKPELKFDSEDYIDIIDWESDGLFEPPFTMSIPDSYLLLFQNEP